MFPIFDNIFNRRREHLPEAAAALMAAAVMLEACSAAPVKMECKEIQMRIDYGDLTTDQLRFAMQELDECNGKIKAAELKDSAFLEGAERRFTPVDSLPADSAEP